MDSIKNVTTFEPLKILGDARRLAILQQLMVAPATLSQLGRIMDMHPAKVRYHLKQLEQADMVALVSTRIVGSFVEKYYQATAKAFMINLAVVPQSAERDAIILLGSHDLALETLAESLSQDKTTPAMYALPVGSLDGLIALRQGACHLAGCHLYDPPSGEFNIPYVRHLFPGLEMRVVTLVRRQQGLLVASGNPLRIGSLEDLVRDDLRFINRKRGSGTRLWLDRRLQEAGIPSDAVCGFDTSVNTHRQVAQAVTEGRADTGLAIQAIAREYDLDFIPLFDERYDLVIPEREYQSDLLAPALDHIHSGAFRQAIQNLAGYQVDDIGQEILIL